MTIRQQPTLSGGVVWLTSFTDDDAESIGEFNLDADHRRWFNQPPVDPDPVERRRHGLLVARRWRDQWSSRGALAFAVRLGEDPPARRSRARALRVRSDRGQM